MRGWSPPFTSSALVRRTIQTEGVDCLPPGLVDGAIVFRGGYPERSELVRRLSLEAVVV